MHESLNPRAARSSLVGQTSRYLLVGGATVVVYLAIFTAALALGLFYLVAIVIAQAIIIPAAFFSYRRWVFGHGTSLAGDFARFLSVWAGGMVAGFVLTPLLVELTPTHPLVAQIIAIVLVTSANFVVHRLWTFKSRASAGKEPQP